MQKIGSSDLTVYPLSLGGNTFGWSSSESESHEVLDAFTAGGGNFIDTADVYSAWVDGNSGGESETIIGSWLAARQSRSRVVLATKVSQHPEFSGLSATNIAAAADASLGRLGTDYIDLYYAHFDDDTTPLDETVSAFNDLVVAGKVRYVALSNYSAERVTEWMRIARDNGFAAPVALQPQYNLMHRRSFETTLAPLATEFDLGVVPYYALASGFLTGKYRSAEDLSASVRGGSVGGYLTAEGLAVIDSLEQIATAHQSQIASVALAWLQAQPTVVAPIASARVVSQLDALLAAAELTLSTEEIATLDAVSAAVPE